MLRECISSQKVTSCSYLVERSKSAQSRAKSSRKTKFVEGWIEFKDKRVASLVAISFNGKKVGGKKGSYNYDDTWNMKYIPKFKWDDLKEKIDDERNTKKDRLKLKITQAKREHDFFVGKLEKSKVIREVLKRKAKQYLKENNQDVNDDSQIREIISSKLIKKNK